MKLQAGDNAPNFSSVDQNGAKKTLTDYQNKWLLLYFYPKDFTGGCTTEACSLRDNFTDLAHMATIVGVSADSAESHKKFAEQYHLPFTLLSDPTKTLIKAYGADGFILPKRTSFLIRPDGTIAKVYENVNPTRHAAEIITDLQVQQSS